MKKITMKKGFTLVEVMVTLIITVIVVGVSSALVITGTNIFARSAQRDVQTNIAETVLTFVSDQLLYAESIEQILSNPPVPTPAKAVMIIKANDNATASDVKGQLYFSRAGDTPERNIFGNAFYQNYQVGIDIKIEDQGAGSMATITVSVYNRAGTNVVLSRSSTKNLLNYGGPVPATFPNGGSGFAIQYVPVIFE